MRSLRWFLSLGSVHPWAIWNNVCQEPGKQEFLVTTFLLQDEESVVQGMRVGLSLTCLLPETKGQDQEQQ